MWRPRIKGRKKVSKPKPRTTPAHERKFIIASLLAEAKTFDQQALGAVRGHYKNIEAAYEHHRMAAAYREIADVVLWLPEPHEA